jgi:hypothetical protein
MFSNQGNSTNPNNEPQQPIMANLPLHYIPIKQEEIREAQVPSTS